jgi:hypothetical protein
MCLFLLWLLLSVKMTAGSEPLRAECKFLNFAIVNPWPAFITLLTRPWTSSGRGPIHYGGEQKANTLGKPYQHELEALSETYGWARSIDLGAIRAALEPLSEENLVVIGSGGSLSAAQLAVTLHERRFGHT